MPKHWFKTADFFYQTLNFLVCNFSFFYYEVFNPFATSGTYCWFHTDNFKIYFLNPGLCKNKVLSVKQPTKLCSWHVWLFFTLVPRGILDVYPPKMIHVNTLDTLATTVDTCLAVFHQIEGFLRLIKIWMYRFLLFHRLVV